MEWVELGEALSRIEQRLAAIEARLDEQDGRNEWMNAEQAAAYLGTTREAIKASERRGRLRGHRGGGRVRYRRADLDAFATSEE